MVRLGELSGTRVFVTGHTGFCGVWLASMLTALGAEVRGYSRDDTSFSTLFPAQTILRHWNSEFGNIIHTPNLRRSLLEFQPDIVFHLAAQSRVYDGYRNPLESFSTNALGTASVLQASLDVEAIRGVVVVTTDKVYEESPSIKTEDSPLKGSDPYSSSKVAAEHIVLGYRTLFKAAGKAIGVMRGGNVIGGGDWGRDRIVPDLIRASLGSKPLSLRNPSATRPWQHVLDLVHAYTLVGRFMLGEKQELSDSEFNVGPDSNHEFSVMDLVKGFESNGIKVNINSVSPKYKEAERLRICSAKSGEVLGWWPCFDFNESVALTSIWYKAVCFENKDPYEVSRIQVEDFLRRVS